MNGVTVPTVTETPVLGWVSGRWSATLQWLQDRLQLAYEAYADRFEWESRGATEPLGTRRDVRVAGVLISLSSAAVLYLEEGPVQIDGVADSPELRNGVFTYKNRRYDSGDAVALGSSEYVLKLLAEPVAVSVVALGVGKDGI